MGQISQAGRDLRENGWVPPEIHLKKTKMGDSVHGAEKHHTVSSGHRWTNVSPYHLFPGTFVSEQGLTMSAQLRVTQVTLADGCYGR